MAIRKTSSKAFKVEAVRLLEMGTGIGMDHHVVARMLLVDLVKFHEINGRNGEGNE